MNQPFGYEGDYDGETDDGDELNPDGLPLKELLETMRAEEGVQPAGMFEVLFWALFGITGVEDLMESKYIQPWTLYLFKAFFASYLVLTIIVLINLLIAMMSDTYCRIQEQSDIG